MWRAFHSHGAQNDMVVEQAYFFWLAPLIGVVVCGVLWYAWFITRAVKHLSAPEHQRFMIPGFSTRRMWLWAALMILALGSMWFALLRVSYDSGEYVQREECARDVIIALDISKSMLARDVNPSRLECSKRKIGQLMKALNMERVGLVLFSQHACVHCPLTSDKNAFSVLLDAVDDDVLSSGGTTALDQALYAAIKICEQSGQQHKKLLLVLTDGEDFSENLKKARDDARRVGLRIGLFGIGTLDGAPIPLRTREGTIQGHQRDQQGNIVISRLQPHLLQAIAQEFGGTYCNVDMQGDSDIHHMVQWVKKHEAAVFTTREHEVRGELFMVGALIACGALLIAWLI